MLTWETTREVNNKGFTVQRSHNGISFDNIGFIPASTLVQDHYAYAFTDLHPFSGSNYYRLEQKDIDERTSLSRTIRLNFVLQSTLSVYPNPASRYINVRGTSAGSMISIYSADGRKYKERRSSSNLTEIDISEMPKGIYFLRVTEGNNSQSFLISVVD